MKAWMRVLEVILTSKNGSVMKFGSNWEKGKDDLNISVSGVKYLCSTSDTATIKISNLTYAEILKIIDGQIYTVEVKAGYRNGNVYTIFKGGVQYISNSINDISTNTVIILCSSEYIAKFSQSRLTFSLNSGINMYSALKYICNKSNLHNVNISSEFKRKILSNTIKANSSSASILEQALQNTSGVLFNTDSSNGGILNFTTKISARRITLNMDTVDFTTAPKMTTDGFTITVLPSFLFIPGDIVVLDNSLIDTSVNSSSSISQNLGMYLNSKGEYMIYEISFDLNNRNSDFALEMLCKNVSLLEGLST